MREKEVREPGLSHPALCYFLAQILKLKKLLYLKESLKSF
jgi:hypothetical protein